MLPLTYTLWRTRLTLSWTLARPPPAAAPNRKSQSFCLNSLRSTGREIERRGQGEGQQSADTPSPTLVPRPHTHTVHTATLIPRWRGVLPHRHNKAVRRPSGPSHVSSLSCMGTRTSLRDPADRALSFSRRPHNSSVAQSLPRLIPIIMTLNVMFGEPLDGW